MDPEAELNHMLSSRNPLQDLPDGPVVKNLSYNTGYTGSIHDQGTNPTCFGATQSKLWFFQQSCMDVRVGPLKKVEHQGTDAFELWCWRRLLRVPWTARRSNQSILKMSPGISLEGMMLKLKLQYFGHLMRRVDSLEKTLMLGGIGGKRRRV